MNTTVLHPVDTTFDAERPGFWTRVWHALEVHGQRRAAAELRRIAILHASTDPELARRMRELAAGGAGR